MTTPIETAYATGMSLYVVIHNPNGKVWNTNTLAFENYNSAHWGQYAISMTEQTNSGYYSAPYPTQIEDVLTSEALYIRGGGSPALGDSSIGIAQSQGANVAAIGNDAIAAANLAASAGTMITGAVIAGTLTSTSFPTDLPDTTDDVYIGRIVVFTDGDLIRQVGNIIAYDGATQTITVAAPFTGAPSSTDTFVIV